MISFYYNNLGNGNHPRGTCATPSLFAADGLRTAIAVRSSPHAARTIPKLAVLPGFQPTEPELKHTSDAGVYVAWSSSPLGANFYCCCCPDWHSRGHRARSSRKANCSDGGASANWLHSRATCPHHVKSGNQARHISSCYHAPECSRKSRRYSGSHVGSLAGDRSSTAARRATSSGNRKPICRRTAESGRSVQLGIF